MRMEKARAALRLVRFHLEQAILLGTVAFGFLVVQHTLRHGRETSPSAFPDTFVALLASWVFMLAFLVLVASPVQLAMHRAGAEARKEIWAGVLTGILPIVLLLAGRAGDPTVALLMLVPFGPAGGWFAVNLRRQLGPR